MNGGCAEGRTIGRSAERVGVTPESAPLVPRLPPGVVPGHGASPLDVSVGAGQVPRFVVGPRPPGGGVGVEQPGPVAPDDLEGVGHGGGVAEQDHAVGHRPHRPPRRPVRPAGRNRIA